MITNSILINRPIDAVFEYAAQFDRHPEWQQDLKTSTLHGPSGLDARGTDSRQMGRRVQTYDWRVSEFDPPRRIGFEALTGPVRPAGTMSFTTDGDATRVDFAMAMNPRGFMKLLAPMIERKVQQANTGHLAKFKEILESGAA
jgi:uncharacterized membrane protein